MKTEKYLEQTIVILLLGITTAALLSSCATQKEIKYMQDIDKMAFQQLTTSYEAKIKKDDYLTIVVSGPDKSVTMPYNLTLTDMYVGVTNADPEKATMGYPVDSKGEINFPILGKIRVEGMTRSELVDYLTYEISKDVKNPVVSVSFRNYKITVLGEVKSPGTYTMDSERMNIYQVLGKAGDLVLTAERKGIILIREVNGRQTYHKIDLTSAKIMNSDYFFMQQNDVIYVPASSERVATATTSTAIWSVILSSITTAVAVATLTFSVLKNNGR